MSLLARDLEWDQGTGVCRGSLADNESMFRRLFERSADAIFLFDPGREVFVDCNRAAVEMMRATSKKQLLMVHPANLSSEFQPDGQSSREKTPEVIELAISKGSHRFEWQARRMDGTEFPLEVLLTPIETGEYPLMATICRDITERKAAEAALRESEARFRSLFERSADAMLLFDPQLGRFIESNQAGARQTGAPNVEALASSSPADLSPERQPNGGLSGDMIAERVKQALASGTLRFEWMTRRYDGSELPVDVVLTAIPFQNRTLLFAVSRDISDRKRAEQRILELNTSLEQRVAQRTAALRESEEKFRALFEGSSQGVVLHDESGILEVNPAAVRIMGCQSPQELVGKHPADMSPPFQPNGETSAVMACQHIRECMAKGSARFDWVSQTPHGREIPLEVTLTRIEWSGRQVIQALISDISERKKAEAELRASEARLRESESRFSAAFRASPVFITISRMDDGRYVLVNEAFLKWTGHRLEEVIGHNSQELSLWADPAEREPFWAELRRTRSIHERECRARSRHGKIFTMLVCADVIEIEGVPHLLSVGQDITERKRAEAELRAGEARLRESEARFSAAFHASPALIGILRLSDGKYVLANDAHLNWLGYKREEVLGRTCLELGMWEDSAERDAILRDMAINGSIRQRECRWLNRHRKRFTILLSAETIQLNDTPHLLTMAMDITERKRAEDDLLKTLEREKELSQLKSNFVSMVSHEFRTPLGIIQSSTELLHDFQNRMNPDEREDQLKSIMRNTRRMAGMMEEVLVLSRLDAGKLIFQPAPLDLNVFFRRVVDEVLSATNRRCPIELSLNSVPTQAQADERLFGHIFTNLLSNGIKYSEAGSTVHLFVARAGRDVVCVIRDKGIGIPEEDLQHLFKAFHRGSNVGTCPGTGLGLLLVKRCVDLHRGTVHVESTIGDGTTVTVKLAVFENQS
jgi:PAS domain S-box-containing protein